MHDPQPSPPSPVTTVTQAAQAAQDRACNEQIRELLRVYGLRTSLIRLKVIDALHRAEREGRRIGVRGVHAQLEQLDIPLSFLSVREVLKRLCSEGVIHLGDDKCYALHAQASALLERRSR
ncbi:fe2+ zn2+ uptake regulation protein [Pseudomonas entomophila]|uniref:fe2+ zn2+ uptake regulation protein n=1 Tax=Pseudomonas entomophila TaxID=312306 RepID=UPI0015E44054|nr:fe2+ zn2+ uptake regulation protein [Pseudomonas entomophila]MBA1189280.1 fe2+ zn2+ uptake regulation protein [Pseudomonas entomophila]